MEHVQDLDPYQRAPQAIKELYKKYRKLSCNQIAEDPDIIDLSDTQRTLENGRVRVHGAISQAQLAESFLIFNDTQSSYQDVNIYEIDRIPGKF